MDNQVGVKYHVQTDWPERVIGLHNFDGGYCGISKVDSDRYCLCYLTTADRLRECGNVIAQLEQRVLCRNPVLKKVLSHCKVLPHFPVTISQISFSKKSQVENGVLMLGDSAGMITPLCGNGMSMALHSSKIAAGLIHLFLQKKIDRQQLENRYQQQWREQFAGRMGMGRVLQRFFGSAAFSNLFVRTFKTFPFLSRPVIRQTHGKPF